LGAARLNLAMNRKLNPFVVAGGGSYMLDFAEINPRFDLTGPGFMLGGGVDYVPQPAFSVRAELCVHVWEAYEESGDGGVAETLALALGAALSF
jgi:hypothetical protein